MTLAEWDRDVAPILQNIEYDCRHAKLYAANILARMAVLPSRPEWTTTAADELDKAIKTLSEALDALEAAKTIYDKKPRG